VLSRSDTLAICFLEQFPMLLDLVEQLKAQERDSGVSAAGDSR
jgi:hypothetical protein